MLARQPNASRWILVAILSAALAANACRFGPGGLSNPPTSTANPAPVVSATLPGRTAVLNDLVGTVLSGPAGGGNRNGQANSGIRGRDRNRDGVLDRPESRAVGGVRRRSDCDAISGAGHRK